MVRIKNKSKITILPALPSSQAQLQSGVISISQGRRGDGKWWLWSIRDALCLLLVLFSSSTGSHMQETVLHKLLQCWSVLWASVLHEFLQSETLPQGAVFQEQAAPAWVPFWVTNLARKLDPAWDLHGLQLTLGHISLLQCEVLHGLQGHHSPVSPQSFSQTSQEYQHHHIPLLLH